MSEPTLQARIAAALARRMERQPEAVRRLLAAKPAYQEVVAETPAPPARRVPRPAPATPLALLNAHLRNTAAERLAAAAPGEPAHEHELASARRFRQAWQASRTVEQLEQALERRPSNAGPLNSHALVLHALGLMRGLSPEYLRRFVAQVESLQWLEQTRDAQPAARPRAAAKAGRSRRKPRPDDA
jgi:hypothetical protein